MITASLDKTARIWTWNTDNQKFLNALKNPRLISTLQGHEGKINCAKFSPDGNQILTTSEDRTARIWDIEQGRLQTLLTGHEDGVKYAEFSPYGDKVVTASADKTARLWDVDNRQILIKPFMTFQHERTVERAKFAFGRQRVITTAGGATLIWDISNEHLITKLSQLVFEPSANEQRLLIISGNTVTVSSPNFQPVRTLSHSNKVDFAQLSEDGQRVVTVSDKTAQIWDIDHETTLITLQHETPIRHIAFSRNGRRVSSAVGNAALLWDADSGQLITTLSHEYPVTYVEFSLDGQKIVTVAEDNKVRVWQISPSTQVLINEAKRLKPRDLTIEQREQYFLPVPDSMRHAQKKIIRGKQLAKAGLLAETQQAFAEAQQLDTTLRFDPAVKAQILTANYALNRGKQFAEEGKSEAAVKEFAKLARLNPNFTLDPKLKTRDILIDTGKSLLIRKQLNEAIAMIQQAQQLDPNLKITVDFSNSLCWYDSIKHGRISKYCNQ